MSKQEFAKRSILLIAGLFFSALGIAITKHAGLGVSPVSSVANILSCKFTSLSLGTWLFIWNTTLVLGQILILRKNFKPIQLLQIPLSLIFGYFTDIGMWIISFVPAEHYAVRLLLVFCGVAALGFGIALAVFADLILNAGEAFVKAVSDAIKKDFGNVKICMDVLFVTISVVLSLLFFDGKIVSTREGTLITALLTGVAVKLFTSILRKPAEEMLKG